MGLTFLAFLAALGLFLLVPTMLRRGGSRTSALVVALVDLFLGLFALSHGLVATTSDVGPNAVGVVFSRISGANLLLALVCLFVFSLSFPRWLGLWAKILSGLVAVGALWFAWISVSTDRFMATILGVPDGVIRFPGSDYDLITGLTAGMALVAAFIHLLRGIFTKDRIHRQRSIVATVGIGLGVTGMWILSRGFFDARGAQWSFYLLPIPTILIGGSASYALFISRMFDWSSITRRALSYVLLTLVYGVPAGIAVAALLALGTLTPLIPAIGAPIIFFAAWSLASSYAERRLERLYAREYREELESGLSHIDLSAGRDAVLSEVQALLASALDFIDFAILIEDDKGLLKTVYAPMGGTAQVDRGSRLQEVVEASGVTVMLRTEVIAEGAYDEVRPELLAFFTALRAEAIVFAREGRRVIGAFALGARRTGGDYTDYDYDSFKAIYGKLFVIAYYLKNVARESILYTVSRELALSDQIIRFALEKVDRIDDPAADAAWATRSTRSLGGDFVDFVRISKQRWFFVLGDVSGKGLSASMNMLILKSMVRTFLRVEHDFTGLVQKVNLFIKENLPRGTFFAGIFGYFDFERNALYFINCGIPTLLLYSPSFDAFVEVQGEGKILGFVRDVAPYLKPRKLSLPPDSLLVAATDGVVESENLRSERFGKDRLIRSVHERIDRPAKEISDGVVEDLLEFTARRQEDDITLLIIKLRQRSRS